MKTLRTSEAAALLNVSPNTLRSWERRFDYPKPLRSPGRHRLYMRAEIVALRDALQDGLSISSAVSAAREAIGADGDAVLKAFLAFSEDEADAAMERSLALRTVERSVEEILLPSLAALRRRRGPRSAPVAFAQRWSADWLMRARRLTAVSDRRWALLVGDASSPVLDPARPTLLAFELCCVRAGFELMSLPVQALDGLEEAVDALVPDAIVIGGSYATDDEVARWAYRVRSLVVDRPFVLYLREIGRVVTPSARVLPSSPLAARDELLTLLAASHPRGDTSGPRGALKVT
jgi:MerR family transcriptional regulator, light-induced transcriptional regulator